MARSHSNAVEHSPPHPEVEGSSPGASFATRREKSIVTGIERGADFQNVSSIFFCMNIATN